MKRILVVFAAFALFGCASQPLTYEERVALANGIAQGFQQAGQTIANSRTPVPQTTTVIGDPAWGQTVWGAHNGIIIPDGYGGGTYWGN